MIPTPAAAVSDLQVDLPTMDFDSVVVDDARSQILVTPGSGWASIYVVGFDGVIRDSINGSPGPSGLVVAGDTLYVAAYDASRIDVYDLNDPTTPVDSYDTSAIGPPRDLVLAGGRLWFSTKQCSDSGADVGRVSLGSGIVGRFTDPDHYDSHTCPWLSARNDGTDIFLLQDHGVDGPWRTTAYDASTSPVTTIGSRTGVGTDLEVRPGGAEFLGGDYARVSSYGMDLSLTGPLTTWWAGPGFAGLWEGMAETPANGDLIAASAANVYGPDIALWHASETSSVYKSYDFYDYAPSSQVWREGLAFSADGELLIAVTGADDFPKQVSVRILHVDASAPVLSLSALDRVVRYGDSTVLTAHLDGGTSNTTLTIYQGEGTSDVLASGPVNAQGDLPVSVSPRRTIRYWVSYDGDEDWFAATDKAVVYVRAVTTGWLTRFYDTAGRYKLYKANQNIYYTARVQPPHEGKNIRIHLEFNFGAGWRDGGTQLFQMDAKGRVRIYFKSGALPLGRYRLKSTFRGDRDHLGSSSSWAYFRVTGSGLSGAVPSPLPTSAFPFQVGTITSP